MILYGVYETGGVLSKPAHTGRTRQITTIPAHFEVRTPYSDGEPRVLCFCPNQADANRIAAALSLVRNLQTWKAKEEMNL